MKQLNAFQEAGIPEPFGMVTVSVSMPVVEYGEFKDINQVNMFNAPVCRVCEERADTVNADGVCIGCLG